MLNQVIVVGKLVEDPELKITKSYKKVTNITLAVNRSYKNLETGKYDTDYINCTLWSGIAESTSRCCKKGSVLGIKGRIITSSKDCTETNKRVKYPEVVAEKVTFINTSNKSKNKLE